MGGYLIILHHLVKNSLSKEKSMENIMKRMRQIAEDIPSKAYFCVLGNLIEK